MKFNSGRNLYADVHTPIRNFYSSSNSVLNKSSGLNEITRLDLMESKCLPLLTYSLPALKLKKDQILELNKAWNSVYRKIFGCNRWESVKSFIGGLGRLDFKYIRFKSIITFLRFNLYSRNNILRYIIIKVLLSEFDNLCDSFNINCNSFMILNYNLSKKDISDLSLEAFKRLSGV